MIAESCQPDRRAPSRRTQPLPALVLGSCLLAVLLALCLPAAAPAAGGQAEPQRQVGLGAYIPHATYEPARIDAFSRAVGRDPIILSSYKPWTEPPLQPSELNTVWEHGAVPMVTWEPWSWEGDQKFPLRAIAAGRYDGYIRRAARVAKAWGHPILLRFAHEMNGTWYPWSVDRPGNSPAIYKRVWRHLVRLFRSEGADNVEWVWAVNVDNGSHSFTGDYPGDRWVDWVGLDGFNWASHGEWNSFTEIFGDSYDELRRLTDRPILITETASNQSGGDKAAWTKSALESEIPAFPAIRAVIWFDEPFNGVDARVNSSPDALKAFRRGVSSPFYGLTRAEFLATPSTLPTPTAAPSPPGGNFGQPSLAYRILQKFHGVYLWIGIAVASVFLIVLALAARGIRRRLATEPRR